MELRERRQLAQPAIVSPAMLSLDLSQNEKEHLPLLAERSFLKPLKGAGLPIGKPEKLLCSSNSRKFWNLNYAHRHAGSADDAAADQM